MFLSFLDPYKKQINKVKPFVDQINALEPEFEKLTNDQIKEKTKNWKADLQDILKKHDVLTSSENSKYQPQENNEQKEKAYKEQDDYLDKILVQAYALVREATKRVQNKRLFDVQLIAGIVLHQGKIAEQKTGEGKTNTAVLPLYLNSLTGRGVHLITPNDYLARHGAGWMGPIYDLLGVSVGVIMQERSFVYDSLYETHEFEDAYAVHLKECERKLVYLCDISYGTNHEYGFDYLRDNLARQLDTMSQTNPNGEWGAHNFAIVDEVDNILIDIARTPLIISSRDSKPTERYQEADRIVKGLAKDADYEVDEKYKNATLTDLGIRRIERLLGINNLYEQDFEMVHLIEQSLISHALYQKDKDYVVKDGKILIVDQFTGRILYNNRYSHGLHQAIEAKEGVEVQEESKTLAEISYQNYYRMYKKLAGMTGTASTEAEEFYKIYKLDVVVIPTNKEIKRLDVNDVVYKTEGGKFKAVADEIEEKYKAGQPVLVGTTSVEKSELLHDFLKRKRIPHEILNAKNHEREALIIAQAGKKGSVTISTNMAGRGVDIILGGDPSTPQEQEEVRNLGGLHVVGTERHESRRIDNQLRGRSGRQGDPGSSKFFVSLQDELMRIFGGQSVANLMSRFGMDDSIPLESGLVNKAIENAQKRVEGFNFDRRKQLVEEDDVMNTHREVVYKLRRRFLELGEGFTEHRDWILNKLESDAKYDGEIWKKNEKKFGEQVWPMMVKDLTLPVIDSLWMDHLVDMEKIKEGIGLTHYAQRDPMVEYKKEGHARFEILLSKLYVEIAERLSRVTEAFDQQPDLINQMLKQAQYKKGEFESGVSEEAKEFGEQNTKKVDGRIVEVKPVVSNAPQVGRNDPCPCGARKADGTPVKYKNCHGKSN